jgi:hypothetical protein
MGALPPIDKDGHAPPLVCGRLQNWPNPWSRCPREATTHVIWTPKIDNGLCCDDHADEARRLWTPYAMHPYRMECSMPGAVFVHDLNLCVVDEGLLGITEPALETSA